MRLPRFRVRSLLIAVGVVALLIWGAMMGKTSFEYYRRAEFFRKQADRWQEIAGRGTLPASFYRESAVYTAQLAAKYHHAMWRPWRPLAPDPHAPGYDQWLAQQDQARKAASLTVPKGSSPR